MSKWRVTFSSDCTVEADSVAEAVDRAMDYHGFECNHGLAHEAYQIGEDTAVDYPKDWPGGE